MTSDMTLSIWENGLVSQADWPDFGGSLTWLVRMKVSSVLNNFIMTCNF